MTCTRPQAKAKNPLTRGRRPHMTQSRLPAEYRVARRRGHNSLLPSLLDHLVRAVKQGQRNGKTERLCGEVEDERQAGSLKEISHEHAEAACVYTLPPSSGWMNPYPFCR